MIKEQLLNKLKSDVEQELRKIKQAYATTQNLVQNGDLKSDGKYDTRATEANYLADGQRNRTTELEQEHELLNEVNLQNKPKTVSIGSLVEIELNKQTRKYFIAPTAGGKMIKVEDDVVLVISVFSPIGDAALGLEVDDDFEVELESGSRQYLVKSIS